MGIYGKALSFLIFFSGSWLHLCSVLALRFSQMVEKCNNNNRYFKSNFLCAFKNKQRFKWCATTSFRVFKLIGGRVFVLRWKSVLVFIFGLAFGANELSQSKLCVQQVFYLAQNTLGICSFNRVAFCSQQTMPSIL